MSADTPTLIGPADVARQLGLSAETVRDWLRTGALRGTRLGTGSRQTWRIRQADVDAMIAAGTPSTTNNV